MILAFSRIIENALLQYSKRLQSFFVVCNAFESKYIALAVCMKRIYLFFGEEHRKNEYPTGECECVLKLDGAAKVDGLDVEVNYV